MTRVKIFQSWAHAETEQLEAQINRWIENEEINVISIELAVAGVGDASDEIAHKVVVLVHYRAG